jgi:hypothetical protein
MMTWTTLVLSKKLAWFRRSTSLYLSCNCKNIRGMAYLLADLPSIQAFQSLREVAALGYGSLALLDHEARDDGFEAFSVQRQLVLRRGVVTSVHPNGNCVVWPCFETTIPMEAGMSGGPVLWYDPNHGPGEQMIACGIISRDFSSDDSKTSYLLPECSTMAMLWPSLALSLHVGQGLKEKAEPVYLLELIRRGIIDDVGDAANNISILLREDERITISRRS